jgi:1-acyl-sn-glycerol-3-phosphate acyltransferase
VIRLRSTLFNLAFFGLTAGLALLCLPLLARRAWARAVLTVWSRAVVALLPIAGIRLRVEGLQNIPPGGCVIASKHQSAFDTAVWFALVPRATYVLKQELLRIPLYGWYARRAGMIAVDRAGGGTALRRMVRAASEAVRDDQRIVIFPEGTRTAPGERRPLQPGIVGLAAATGAPIVPVATDSGLVWGRRAFLKRPGLIQISVRQPLPRNLPRAALLAALAEAIELDEPVRRSGGVENPVEDVDAEVRVTREDHRGTP